MNQENLLKLNQIYTRARRLGINVEFHLNDDETGYVSFYSPASEECWSGKTHSLPLAFEAAMDFLDSLYKKHNPERLTINQIMVLLDAARGTLSEHRHMGTYKKDLCALNSRGLLREDGEITNKGDAIVSSITIATGRKQS